jgi:tetratricopeptide (TPR) repeat protein
MADTESTEPPEGAKLVDQGIRHYEAGRVARAIDCFTQAQRLYQRQNEVLGTADCLSNLANCYYRLGQIQQAIDYGEDALTLRRGLGDWQGVGLNLSNLGCCYMVLGQTARAAEFFEEALGLAGEWEDQPGRARRLNNLGNVYGALGQTQRAIECYEEALTLQRALGDRPGEAVHLTNLSGILVDADRCAEAVAPAQASVAICEAYHLPASYSNLALALAHLCTGDLPAARQAAEAARQSDEPTNNHTALAVLALVSWLQGDRAAAHEAGAAAVAQAQVMLERDAENVDALDAKMLALCTLALGRSGPASPSPEVAEALVAYRAARALNQDAGVVGRVARLLNLLAAQDPEGVLKPVTAAMSSSGSR